MYLVVELQTTGNQTANIATAYESREQADSKFHTILASAAISQVPVHAAVILDEHGDILANGSYEHGGGKLND